MRVDMYGNAIISLNLRCPQVEEVAKLVKEVSETFKSDVTVVTLHIEYSASEPMSATLTIGLKKEQNA